MIQQVSVQPTAVLSVQIMEQHPTYIQQQHNVEQQQMTTYGVQQAQQLVEPPKNMLVRKLSYIHQQSVDVQQQQLEVDKHLVEMPSSQSLEIHSLPSDSLLHNPVLKQNAVASDHEAGHLGTAESVCGQCCSDFYTTDSCGESSAAESAEVAARNDLTAV